MCGYAGIIINISSPESNIIASARLRGDGLGSGHLLTALKFPPAANRRFVATESQVADVANGAQCPHRDGPLCAQFARYLLVFTRAGGHTAIGTTVSLLTDAQLVAPRRCYWHTLHFSGH